MSGGPWRRWSWLAVLVVGLALFELVRQATITTGNPNFVPSLILLGAVVVPASFVTFVADRRLPYGVPTTTVGAVALVGGVVGVVTAGVLEYDTLRRLGALQMVGVGVIEEGAKLLPCLAVLLLTRHRRPADGLLVGVAAGAGFAALETMGYGFVVLLRSRGDLAALDGVLLLRGVLSPAAHMAWTGLTAAALWRLADDGWSGAGLRRTAGVFLLAVALHATWDTVASTPAYVVLGAVSLGLLTTTAHRLSARPAAAPVPAVGVW